jgi:acetyl-CoA C-acetyltransferase
MINQSIVGWAHSPFGKLVDDDLESLIARVAGDAIVDAGIEPDEIDSIFIGNFNSGFSKQDFPSSLVLQSVPELRFKPATRCENACASGSAALYAARHRLAASSERFALVIGAEKMTDSTSAQTGEHLLGASYRREESGIAGGFAGVFGQIAQSYFQRYGDHSDALACIAAKNHHNGMDNPYAHLRKDFGFAFCREESEKNPLVAPPLKRTDCSPVSDGAAALVLRNDDLGGRLQKSVKLLACSQVNDLLPMSQRDMTRFEAGERAWAAAFEAAGITLQDLSFVETHDCFTIAELIEYETMGLAAPGQGWRAAVEGWTVRDGRLPINRSGGLKSKGHPVGATGVSMHVMAAMQLSGEAAALQLPNAELGAVYNMGGSAVANYVSLLGRGDG